MTDYGNNIIIERNKITQMGEKYMKKKNKILVSYGVLVIFVLLFSIVPSQAETVKSQFTVLTYPGTDIYVDGVYADHSYGNWIMIYVPYGTHTIKVTKSGYYDFVKTIDINTKISSVFVDKLIPVSTANPKTIETIDMLKAADAWSNNRIVDGFASTITTQQLLIMADKWANN
jgi:hypothetical protein